MDHTPSMSIVRPDAVPRNSSMDSAMSSVSSSAGSAVPSTFSHGTNHSYQSSSETTVTSSPPLTNTASLLTQMNDNPTAAIDRLLREKQALTSRNEQLWRLVEKQRHMLHGLHADLERALKDKERYRRRAKDLQQESVPSLPRNPAVASEIREAAQRNRDPRGSHGKGLSHDSVASSAPLSSPRSPRGQMHHVAPSQDSQFSMLSEDSQLGVETSNGCGEPSRIATQISHEQQASPVTPKATQQQSISSPGEKARKAAPPPLNLSETHNSPSQAAHPQASASDYGDDDDDGERISIPQFERGRRRTREQDDREREIVAMAEEQRSRSGKSKKGKAKQNADGEVNDTVLPSPRKTSPEEASAAAPGRTSAPKATFPTHLPSTMQPTDSIASILAPSQPARAAPDLPQIVGLPPKSPGLPMSPKPRDRPTNAPLPRAPVNGLASPGPISPRQGLPLSPRAPKYPIPMPNTAPTGSFPSSVRRDPDPSDPNLMTQRMPSKTANNAQVPHQQTNAQQPNNEIYRGFVSEQFPGLLLAPNALPLVIVRVSSSRLRPATTNPLSRGGEEDGVFTLGVYLRSDGKQLWRVEKKPTSISPLDHALRKYVKLSVSHPDRSIFTGHAPAKVDARRATLNRYFGAMLETPMDDKTALIVCDYFSKDTLPPEEHADLSSAPEEPNSPTSPKLKARKEGILAKKGKQFGGWKARHFLLDNAQLKHFDAPGGAPLGIIKLQQAQIARPNAKDLEEDPEFRHAFMILEPKRKDSSSLVRHVLCAESDQERDAWVEALTQHLGTPQPIVESPPSSPRPGRTDSFGKTATALDSISKRRQHTKDSLDSQLARELQAIHYDDTIPLEAPKLGTPVSNAATTPSTLPDDNPSSGASASIQHPAISGPVAGGPIQNASMWGNKSPSPTRLKDKEMKKRSVFGFMRSNPDEPHSSHGGRRGLSPRPPVNADRRAPARAVFGAPLADAAEYSQPTGLNICLPSPVYRCIEYLEANNAANEEGIFRLSGSNAVIRQLKERFDTERDVNLLDGPYVDVHAVASLLKLYLRELPDTILTRDKYVDFQHVLGINSSRSDASLPPLTNLSTEVEDKNKRLAAINLLIHQLPEANREVLVALSRYLIKVVSNSDTNRMTIKNVGIVFAPTLNIPNPLVFFFITDFDSVFTAAPADPEAASPVLEDIATFKAKNPQAAGVSLAENQMQNIAASAGLGSTAAALDGISGTVPSVQQRMNETHQQSPKASPNSFTEQLADHRQQLRQISAEARENGISVAQPSTPPSAQSTNSAARRPRQSPSPASRAYKASMTPSKSTPPPQEGGESAGMSFVPGSSNSSSPSSFVSSLKGRDSPSLGFGGTFSPDNLTANHAAASRKAKRESAMLGNLHLGAEPPDAARRKSSFTRLKENMGNNVLREE